MASKTISDYANKMTPEEARAFIRKVMGPETETITGDERKHLLLIFAMLEPHSQSNNQRTWTDVYFYTNKEYHVTYGFGGDEDPLVELLLDSKI